MRLDLLFQQLYFCKLQAFRMAAGQNAYPNIEVFIEELKKQSGNKSVSLKKPL